MALVDVSVFSRNKKDNKQKISCQKELEEKKSQKERCNKDLSRHFTEKDMQVANKHIKRCSTSLVTRKI